VILDTSDGPIEVTLVDLHPAHGKARLGFTAPQSVRILREDLLAPPPETK